MMMYVLNLALEFRNDLWAHLLPSRPETEQAAFLFCETTIGGDRAEFTVVDSAFLQPDHFAAQESDYLQLSDAARIGLIRRAHALGASLVELHSHPGPWPAAFSWSDRRGLRETVPHMRWRLKRRPYLAIVVAPDGFDALVWWRDSDAPEALQGIQVGAELMTPTNASLKGWDNGY